MHRLASLNLIRAFDYYLIITFIVGTAMRVRQYGLVLRFVFAFPGRWPKLFDLARQHRTIFLSWPTLLPTVLTFALMLGHMLALRLVWVSAEVTPANLWGQWLALGAVVVLGCLMLYFDFDAVFNVAAFDQAALEKDLERAEYWLNSWAAPALRILTFGFLNPRGMVHEEVRKSLIDAAAVVNQAMWLWALQIGFRLAFGLSLWLTWALG